MKSKEQLNKFIKHVQESGRYLLHDASFQHHFEMFVFTPDHKRRFRMDKEQFEYFMINCKSLAFTSVTYGQGIGLEPIYKTI